MANQLKNETSPYLLQHADNPVDWYPWGDEALARARSEDRPILLSIGYSACHWCHVMAHESFENEDIASLMNEHFINIKVDREERPDLDAIYMAAVQTMTGHGGWPMTVFLTPDGKPFYGGTYYPPQDRGGMPGFPRVLTGVAEAYRDRREQVLESASSLAEHLNAQFSVELPGSTLDMSVLESALESLHQQFDDRNGGFGDAPKFPAAMSIDLLLRLNQRFDDDRSSTMIHTTLDRMARGGLYDQIGGGFHRYTVDGIWLVPHFEKMLYDNALLAHAYTAAFHRTGESFYHTIAGETLDFVLQEMTSPDGGFYSTLDADTEGEEGKFYVWQPSELRQVLGDEDGDAVADLLGVTESGNFEGSNVLSIPRHNDRDVWRSDRFAALRQKLYEARMDRTYPGRDEKILTSWNGMMLRAFAVAGRVFNSDNYLAAARENATFIRDHLWVDNRLLHSYKDGDARITGFLEDYAFLIDGLIELYQATSQAEWLSWAFDLADVAVDEYYDADAGAFFDTSNAVTDLITRPREVTDNAVPSGNSVICESLLRLSMFSGNTTHREIALDIIEDFAQLAAGHAHGLSRMLCAADLALGPRAEIALVGPRQSELHDVVKSLYLPRAVVAASEQPGADADVIPLLAGREAQDGNPTAYVCVDHACQLPTSDPDEFRSQVLNALDLSR